MKPVFYNKKRKSSNNALKRKTKKRRPLKELLQEWYKTRQTLSIIDSNAEGACNTEDSSSNYSDSNSIYSNDTIDEPEENPITRISAFLESEGLRKYLLSPLGGNRKYEFSSTMINDFIQFLLFTYACKYNKVLSNEECLSWVHELLENEYMLVTDYLIHCKNNKALSSKTMQNHNLHIKIAFDWYILTNPKINSSLTDKIYKVIKNTGKSMAKEDQKRLNNIGI